MSCCSRPNTELQDRFCSANSQRVWERTLEWILETLEQKNGAVI